MSQKNIFITGATGAIGSALVGDFLHHTNDFLILLIRGTPEEQSNKITKLCQFWGITNNSPLLDRIKVISGDISQRDFGLDHHDSEFLQKNMTHMVHTAGNVRMNLTMNDALKETVDVANHIILFLKGCQQLKKVEVVSTIGVVGRMKDGIKENQLTHQSGFHNNYEAAKYEAEKIWWQACKEGLPITLHRPSMVIGDSQSGKIIHFQVFYYISEFLKGFKTFGILPNFKDYQLDLVPVDYVAKAIRHSVNDVKNIGKVLHLVSGKNSTPIQDIIQKLQAEGAAKKNIIFINTNLFLLIIHFLKLFTTKKIKKQISTLPYFLTYLKQKQLFTNHETISYLQQNKIHLPLFANYGSQALKYYESNKQETH